MTDNEKEKETEDEASTISSSTNTINAALNSPTPASSGTTSTKKLNLEEQELTTIANNQRATNPSINPTVIPSATSHLPQNQGTDETTEQEEFVLMPSNEFRSSTNSGASSRHAHNQNATNNRPAEITTPGAAKAIARSRYSQLADCFASQYNYTIQAIVIAILKEAQTTTNRAKGTSVDDETDFNIGFDETIKIFPLTVSLIGTICAGLRDMELKRLREEPTISTRGLLDEMELAPTPAKITAAHVRKTGLLRNFHLPTTSVDMPSTHNVAAWQDLVDDTKEALGELTNRRQQVDAFVSRYLHFGIIVTNIIFLAVSSAKSRETQKEVNQYLPFINIFFALLGMVAFLFRTYVGAYLREMKKTSNALHAEYLKHQNSNNSDENSDDNTSQSTTSHTQEAITSRALTIESNSSLSTPTFSTQGNNVTLQIPANTTPSTITITHEQTRLTTFGIKQDQIQLTLEPNHSPRLGS